MKYPIDRLINVYLTREGDDQIGDDVCFDLVIKSDEEHERALEVATRGAMVALKQEGIEAWCPDVGRLACRSDSGPVASPSAIVCQINVCLTSQDDDEMDDRLFELAVESRAELDQALVVAARGAMDALNQEGIEAHSFTR